MTFYALFLGALVASAYCTTIKVANTMGPDVKVNAKCASADDTIGPKDLNDGQDMSWSFEPNVVCSTEYWCDVSSSDGKKAHFTVFKGSFFNCDKDDAGFFLRGDGIYKGKLDGSGINKVQGW